MNPSEQLATYALAIMERDKHITILEARCAAYDKAMREAHAAMKALAEENAMLQRNVDGG